MFTSSNILGPFYKLNSVCTCTSSITTDSIQRSTDLVEGVVRVESPILDLVEAERVKLQEPGRRRQFSRDALDSISCKVGFQMSADGIPS